MAYLKDTCMATYCLRHDYLDLFLYVYFSFFPYVANIYIFVYVFVCLV